jgi:hypothetical protein
LARARFVKSGGNFALSRPLQRMTQQPGHTVLEQQKVSAKRSQVLRKSRSISIGSQDVDGTPAERAESMRGRLGRPLRPFAEAGMTGFGVRREKAALSSGCEAHPAIRSSRKQSEQSWVRLNANTQRGPAPRQRGIGEIAPRTGAHSRTWRIRL